MEKSKLYYDTGEAMDFIKKKFPWIPRFIIRRVLFGEEFYMKKQGIIDYEPTLDLWR